MPAPKACSIRNSISCGRVCSKISPKLATRYTPSPASTTGRRPLKSENTPPSSTPADCPTRKILKLC